MTTLVKNTVHVHSHPLTNARSKKRLWTTSFQPSDSEENTNLPKKDGKFRVIIKKIGKYLYEYRYQIGGVVVMTLCIQIFIPIEIKMLIQPLTSLSIKAISLLLKKYGGDSGENVDLLKNIDLEESIGLIEEDANIDDEVAERVTAVLATLIKQEC